MLTHSAEAVRWADKKVNPNLVAADEESYADTALVYLPYRNKTFCITAVVDWSRQSNITQTDIDDDVLMFKKDDGYEFNVRCADIPPTGGTYAIIYSIDRKDAKIDTIFTSLRSWVDTRYWSRDQIVNAPQDQWLLGERAWMLFQVALKTSGSMTDTAESSFPEQIKSYFLASGYRLRGCGPLNCSFERPGARVWLVARDGAQSGTGKIDMKMDAIVSFDNVGKNWLLDSADFQKFLSAAPSVYHATFRFGDY